MNLVEERYQRRLAEADASLAAAREEAHNLTKKVTEMEEEIRGEQGRHDELSRAVRAAEHDRQKMADACDQVNNLIVFFSALYILKSPDRVKQRSGTSPCPTSDAPMSYTPYPKPYTICPIP